MARVRSQKRIALRVLLTEALLKANPRDRVVLSHLLSRSDMAPIWGFWSAERNWRVIAGWRAMPLLDPALHQRLWAVFRLPRSKRPSDLVLRLIWKHDPLCGRSLPDSPRKREITALYQELADYAVNAMPKSTTKLARAFYRRGRKLDWVRHYYGRRAWEAVAGAIYDTYHRRLSRPAPRSHG